MNKVCSKCNKNQPTTNFYADVRNKDGYNGVCKSCIRDRVNSRYKTNSKNVCARQKILRNKHPCRSRSDKSLYDHRRKGYKINISNEEMCKIYETTDVCPICGHYMEKLISNGHNDLAQTLDRINNEQEINKNNVWVICHRCNTVKGERPMKEFVEFSKMVYEKFKDIYI